jgi:hypothetical protein
MMVLCDMSRHAPSKGTLTPEKEFEAFTTLSLYTVPHVLNVVVIPTPAPARRITRLKLAEGNVRFEAPTN